MLYRCGFDNVELGIRLACDLPVAHIAVIGTVNLADCFLFDCNALHSLDSNDSGHTDTTARLNRLAERGGLDVVIYDAGNVFLRD